MLAVLEPSGMVTSTSGRPQPAARWSLEPWVSFLGSTRTKNNATNAATPARTATTTVMPLGRCHDHHQSLVAAGSGSGHVLVAAAVRAERWLVVPQWHQWTRRW